MHHLHAPWRRSMVLVVVLTWACGTMIGHAAHAAQAATPAGTIPETRPVKDIRFVIFHTPGPKWVPGKSLFEQDGVRDHVDHYRQLLAQGKLLLGGPHLDSASGGMMIPEAGLPEDEIAAFAQADPAVRSGLLIATVRPWLIGMKK